MDFSPVDPKVVDVVTKSKKNPRHLLISLKSVSALSLSLTHTQRHTQTHTLSLSLTHSQIFVSLYPLSLFLPLSILQGSLIQNHRRSLVQPEDHRQDFQLTKFCPQEAQCLLSRCAAHNRLGQNWA